MSNVISIDFWATISYRRNFVVARRASDRRNVRPEHVFLTSYRHLALIIISLVSLICILLPKLPLPATRSAAQANQGFYFSLIKYTG